jgi:6,7-dimethyl-8-ribityllumazine synthase
MTVLEGTHDARDLRFALVVSRFNDFITDRLERGALEALSSAGASPEAVEVLKVPGAYEIPQAAAAAAATGRFDAIVCLGCLIRGETPHFDYISSAVSQGIMAASAAAGIPMTFGVLTVNAAEQAIERAVPGPANKGWEAAIAAVEMARLGRRLRSGPPPQGGVR